ncbi:unnamed protein product [Leptidea sinapis]|uniref:Uncharacterized protein n=1 Tax=Leptidea sinapis TaxID=189913 RepID=A0A5E4PV90_9NEOP|nr:unnamed protein product [Leptidea sinapis]
MLGKVIDTLWSEYVWLPPNVTWSDITPGPEKTVNYTNPKHVFFPIPLALAFICLRYVLERVVFAPFGRYLGINAARPRRAPDNPKLEAAYRLAPKNVNQVCNTKF